MLAGGAQDAVSVVAGHVLLSLGAQRPGPVEGLGPALRVGLRCPSQSLPQLAHAADVSSTVLSSARATVFLRVP